MENELLHMDKGQDGGGPPWWKPGARVRRKFDGQQAIADYTGEGQTMVEIKRGVMGTLHMIVEPSDWEPDELDLTLTDLQVARICYEADRTILTLLGVPAVPEWVQLSEKSRLHWMSHILRGDVFTGEYAELRDNVCSGLVKLLKKAQ